MRYKSFLYKIITFFCNIFASVTWNGLKALFNGGVYWELLEEDHNYLREVLKPNYYVILNRRKTHLTTYLISLANLIKTGKFAHFTHALMNVDDGNVDNDADFKLMESTGEGVHFSSFMHVFDCDSVVLLRPKGFTDDDWRIAMDRLLKQEGKEYDNLFDLCDDTHLSCVELVRTALQAVPDYATRFARFESLIQEHGNLTPQMYYDCGDFEVVWEVRRP